MNPKLEQRKLGRRQSFEICANHELRVEVRGLAKEENFVVPLGLVNPNGSRVNRSHLAPLLVAAPFGLLLLVSMIAGAVATIRDDPAVGGWWMIGTGCGVIAAPFLFQMYRCSVNALIFTAANGSRLPLC